LEEAGTTRDELSKAIGAESHALYILTKLLKF